MGEHDGAGRDRGATTPVILLPGITVPAHVAFAPLVAELGATTVVTKELEVYRDAQPPPGYRLEVEVDGLERAAAERGLERFHLVGHSLGGAIALAYLATRPARVASVALNEPATDFSEADRAAIAAEDLAGVPEHERMRRFVAQFVRPGVELPLPPPGPAGPEMAKRPAGVAAAIAAVDAARADQERLRAYPGPVLYTYGARSHARWEAMAERLRCTFADCTVERFEERHHLDTPHQAEPARLAKALHALWDRADP